MIFRNIANPRRTTLAHLDSAEELRLPERTPGPDDLPERTANPGRTVVVEIPPGA